MCGICGCITRNRIEHDVFDKMVDSMIHRGPDDRGTWYYCEKSGYNISLGHRRLSILDLSTNGHQPMVDMTQRYCIVFNGEIYNYRELLNEVSEYNLCSTSDTEVLLYLYVKYGEKCVDYLNGMFAFAIYDIVDNSLFMARDRMGEKPLYYYVDKQDIVFASELKPIMNYPVFHKEINEDILVQYFSQNAILPPNTIFKNTFKLAAGECATWKNGELDVKKYYSPINSYFENSNKSECSYTEYKTELKNLIIDSVEKRLIADVPTGTFLSGGIDSTLISAVANEVKASDRIDTFSIGFADKRFDESIFAKESAKYLGTRHHEKIMNEGDLMSTLEDLVKYYDEPFSDASQLPTMLVAQFARENVTVTLAGDGGDELFAGYSSNDTLRTLRKLDPILSPMRTIVPSVVSNSLTRDRDRILFGKKSGVEKIQYCTKLREEMAKAILLHKSDVNGTVYDNQIAMIEDWTQQRMLYDMISYLPDEIMTKTDRASMRYSLEMRAPLLDHRIVDYSMQIPLKYKYKGDVKKYILKDILYDYIPEEMMNRPKQGFAAPIYRWLNNELWDDLTRYTSKDFLSKQRIFDYEAVQQLLKRFKKRDESTTTQVVWGLFVFQMWYRSFGL